MNFQFYCPQGHLLEGDSSQAGSQITCPLCHILFIVPDFPDQNEQAPPPQNENPFSFTSSAKHSSSGPDFSALGAIQPSGKSQNPFSSRQFQLPGLNADDNAIESAVDENPDAAPDENASTGIPDLFSSDGSRTRTPFTPTPSASALKILHIPCPSGHILDVPKEMLGEKAVCPFCRKQFTLKFEKSLEHRREVEKREERIVKKKGKAWFYWSVIALVVTVIGVIALIFS